ncbi:hypothetical protein H4R35_005122 [Dimargaris xerosporica]|nr:hypothetical protein H4R35_005122 [Dimargaris xerosporica]
MDTSPSESETALAAPSPAVTASDPATTSPPAKRLKTKNRAAASPPILASAESRRGTGRPRRASQSKPAPAKSAASNSAGRTKETRQGGRTTSNQEPKPSVPTTEKPNSAPAQPIARSPNNGMDLSDNAALSPAGSLSDVPSRSPSPMSSLSSTYSPLPEPTEEPAALSTESVGPIIGASNDRAGSPSAAGKPKLKLSFKAGQMDDLTHLHAKESVSTVLTDISSSSSLSTLPSVHPSQSSDTRSDTLADRDGSTNPTSAVRRSSPPPDSASNGNTSPAPTSSHAASPLPSAKEAQDQAPPTTGSPAPTDALLDDDPHYTIPEPTTSPQATATVRLADTPQSSDSKAGSMDVDAVSPSTQVAHPDAMDRTEVKSESEGSAHVSSSSRHSALKVLTQIEENFARLRERLYEEKASELEEELRLVESNQHPELMDSFQRLDSKRSQVVQITQAQYDLYADHLQIMRQAALESIERTYNESRFRLRQWLLSRFEYQLRRASDEKRQVDQQVFDKIVPIVPPPLVSRCHPLPMVQGPPQMFVDTVMGLKDQEIDADLRLLQGPVHAPRPTAIKARAEPGGPYSYPLPSQALGYSEEPLTNARPMPPVASQFSPPKPFYPEPPSAQERSAPSTTYYSPTPSATKAPVAEVPPDNAIVDRDQLYCNGHRFVTGDMVYVDNVTSGRFSAKIVAVNGHEITLQRTNGSKTKVLLHSINSRATQLFPKDHAT